MTDRTCAYRRCSNDLDEMGKHPTARFCSKECKRLEHRADHDIALTGFWGQFGGRPRNRPALRG